MDGEFLPKPPGPLRREAPPMPTIIGVTKYESLIFLFLAKQRVNQKTLRYCEETFESMAKALKGKMDDSDIMTLQTFRDMYGINDMMKKDKKALGLAIVKISSDVVNNAATHSYCIKAASSSAPCWRYVLEQFQPAQTRIFNPFFPFNGATHCTDLIYLFDFNFFQNFWIKTPADRKMQHIFPTYFTNFVKYGDPNICTSDKSSNTTDLVYWEPITAEKPERQMFLRAEPFMGDNPDRKRLDRLCVMWNYFCENLGYAMNK
ncbi:unnamed protein product [Bursaphelenchus xylophilus]|uniref:(pine wood nematode) hypothetical protein n=1 Tax=Bursaphelenchus xylophilus TaxID=6326 RepID=A0A1I7RK61_BURXY|nr:unnamed protein product [Bursaphelenchus xylophilus]CAG9131479.1 unnamed protein product [Bursaphelenchus xylophilus]